MKRVFLPLFALLTLLATPTAFAEPAVQTAKRLDVYYFHSQRRCPTCLAVEKETRAVIDSAFKQETDAGIVKLTVLNLDDPGSKSTAEKFGVWGSTLLLVDEAGHKTDLTGLAFRSARNDPEAFRRELRAAIQQQLEPGKR